MSKHLQNYSVPINFKFSQVLRKAKDRMAQMWIWNSIKNENSRNFLSPWWTLWMHAGVGLVWKINCQPFWFRSRFVGGTLRMFKSLLERTRGMRPIHFIIGKAVLDKCTLWPCPKLKCTHWPVCRSTSPLTQSNVLHACIVLLKHQNQILYMFTKECILTDLCTATLAASASWADQL